MSPKVAGASQGSSAKPAKSKLPVPIHGRPASPAEADELSGPVTLGTQRHLAAQHRMQGGRDRLDAFWATAAVVSALLLAVSCPPITAPQAAQQCSSAAGRGKAHGGLYAAYAVVSSASASLLVVAMVLALALLMASGLTATDDGPDDLDLRRPHRWLSITLAALLGAALLSLTAATCLAAFHTYPAGAAAAITAIAGSGALLAALAVVWVALWTSSSLRSRGKGGRTEERGESSVADSLFDGVLGGQLPVAGGPSSPPVATQQRSAGKAAAEGAGKERAASVRALRRSVSM